ncbi:nucleotide exchange factor GrpE [Anaerosporobacter sp.]|uniref:nucleotide exchange factor GrpE n=1 Tax=Anaerosporobacter sp. TaxID=1872529 RepID=UPI00286FA297|nr:nucleotide exchange factor GrpE [Anaerosporobacter sp.]
MMKEELEQETTEETVEATVEDIEDVGEEEITESDEDTEKSSKSFFKKDKKEKKDKKDAQIEELKDRSMRQMAEFENFRKRSEKEKSQMFEIGAKSIVEKILPVIDNFERGLGAITEEEKESAFVQGIEKIYKQMVSSLEEAGVVAIEAVGKEFDPNLHNAVMHAEDENFGENTVSDEFQKGYMYKDSVVRHSMVKVVN